MNKHIKGFSYAKYGYLFVIPFVLAYAIFWLYPTFYTAILSFTNCKGLGMSNWKFLTEDVFLNYKTVLANKTFQESLSNTVIIWIMNFIPQMLMALLLTAWFTNNHNRIKGQGFFKVVFYMPNIITAATVAILFNVLFQFPMSPMQDFIKTLGISETGIEFLQKEWVSRGIVAFIQFWMWYGYTMILLISGVLGINPEVFEAAEIDGANGWQTFFRVTLPNLKTIMLFTLVTALIGGLNMFDIPKLFLQGGPGTATLTTNVFIYNQAFSGSYLYARASAASMIMFVIIAIVSSMLFFALRDKDEVAERRMKKEIRKEQRLQEKEERKQAKALKEAAV